MSALPGRYQFTWTGQVPCSMLLPHTLSSKLLDEGIQENQFKVPKLEPHNV